MKEKVTKDGKLLLTYNDLKRNNELEIQYIAAEAATRYEENGIVDPVKVIVSADNSTSDIYSPVEGDIVPSNPSIPEVTNESNVGLIIGCVAAGVVLLVAVVGVTLVLKKRRKTA